MILYFKNISLYKVNTDELKEFAMRFNNNKWEYSIWSNFEILDSANRLGRFKPISDEEALLWLL